MRTFSTFEAKNRLSELIASAERGEPQVITKNGRKSAVVISYQEFERLTARSVPFVDFLLGNPFRTAEPGENDGPELDLSRDKSDARDATRSGRDVDFSGEDFR